MKCMSFQADLTRPENDLEQICKDGYSGGDNAVFSGNLDPYSFRGRIGATPPAHRARLG
jgi:hypothetical protein